MSHEQTAPRPRGVRKGARSCVQCRRRKVRCLWLSEGADACQNCINRGGKCEVQIHMIPTSNIVTQTSRARIKQLESDVSNLWTTVRKLEARLGGEDMPAEAPMYPQTIDDRSSPNRMLDDDSDTDASELSSAIPPSHLHQLFDNRLLGSSGHEESAPSPHIISMHKQRTFALRKLMPSREDMVQVAAQATIWLSLYKDLFPVTSLMKDGDELLLQYDRLQGPNADSIEVSALLLSVAITIQQTPDDVAKSWESIKNVTSFIKEVSDCVEHTVICDDDLVGNLLGIEMILLFVRLHLGRSKIRKLWLLIRHITALAEMLGLPRASILLSSQNVSPGSFSGDTQQHAPSPHADLYKQKARVWEHICATDRIVSMMWSLPVATASFILPQLPSIDSLGQVNTHSFTYKLSDIASRVQEVDNLHASGKPPSELVPTVILIDQALRTLAGSTPKIWWQTNWAKLSAPAVLQYWHQYLRVRAHLQLALKYDDECQEFAFNFITCLDACQDLARHYLSLRRILPVGFFANKMFDLQAFTATVFLLLTSYRSSCSSGTFFHVVDLSLNNNLVDQVLRTMDVVTTPTGGNFAQQAAEAVRALRLLLQQPQSSESREITLNLALVGKIHVSRKPSVNVVPSQPYPTVNVQSGLLWPNTLSQAPPPRSSDLNSSGDLSYSMEIPEDYPFFSDEGFGAEQWLTWSGQDGQS